MEKENRAPLPFPGDRRFGEVGSAVTVALRWRFAGGLVGVEVNAVGISKNAGFFAGKSSVNTTSSAEQAENSRVV